MAENSYSSRNNGEAATENYVTGVGSSAGTGFGAAVSELPGMLLPYRLDGKNYLQWAQLVQTFLKGRGKLSHLTSLPPAETDPNFQVWDIEDSLIMSWLWNAMQPDVSRNYMFLSTAREIWEVAKQTYSKVQDVSVIYEVKTKISSTKQGGMTVTEYYNSMNGLWLELDQYQKIKMVCSADAATLNKIMERNRIVEFLAGLNSVFDQVRVQILD